FAETRLYGLEGKTVGIVGLGNIGKKVARRLRGFECKIVYYDIIRLPEHEEDALGVRYVLLDELLATADVVTLHTPLTSVTQNMISDRQLALMKPTAILVNTCRGPVVDERALHKALITRRIAGAGLDVMVDEPPSKDNPLLNVDTCTITPHTAGPTWENSPRSSAGPAAPPEPDDGLQGASPRPVGERGGVHSRRRRCGNGARLDASHRRRRRRLRAPPPQSGSVGARAHALPPLPSWRAAGTAVPLGCADAGTGSQLHADDRSRCTRPPRGDHGRRPLCRVVGAHDHDPCLRRRLSLPHPRAADRRQACRRSAEGPRGDRRARGDTRGTRPATGRLILTSRRHSCRPPACAPARSRRSA